MAFRKAVRQQMQGRIMLFGASGAGKTYTALTIARELAGPNGSVAFIDTELRPNPKTGQLQGSSECYAGLFDFDVSWLDNPSPKTVRSEIREAHGADVLIVDSVSHLWEWVLAQVDHKKGMSAWNKPKGELKLFVKDLLMFPGHVIACARGVQKYETNEVEQNGRSKKEVTKLGVGQQFDKNFEFEMDIVGRMDEDHTLHVVKSRYPEISGETYKRPGPDFARTIRDWLDNGQSREESSASEVAAVLEMLAEASTDEDLRRARARGLAAVNGLGLSEERINSIRDAVEATRKRINQAAPAAEEGEAA